MVKGFEDLGVNWSILEEIKKRGFKSPTAIQKKVIPISLLDKNIIAAAPTGSGKTLAFAIRAIQNASQGKGMQTIVITPTRELANQVGNEIKSFADLRGLKVKIIFGGQKASLEQFNQILESEILVTTPGMLLEHIETNYLDITPIKTLILDEADSLITTEFEEDIIKIVEKIPRTRQTMMFSATITPEVAKHANKYMRNPVKIYAGTKVENKKLKQFIYEVEASNKLSLFIHLLKTEKAGLSIVFTNRSQIAEFIAKNIKKQGFEVGMLHGDTSKGKRNKVIADFMDNKLDILVATDVAARGLDFEGVTHVYNYNVPADETKYVHRIGRTARAGAHGQVINLVAEKDAKNIINILQTKHIHLIRKEVPHDLELIKAVNVNKSK